MRANEKKEKLEQSETRRLPSPPHFIVKLVDLSKGRAARVLLLLK